MSNADICGRLSCSKKVEKHCFTQPHSFFDTRERYLCKGALNYGLSVAQMVSVELQRVCSRSMGFRLNIHDSKITIFAVKYLSHKW